MGRHKDMLENGYSCDEDIYVCDDCFEDYAIKEFIRDNAIENYCDYCKKKNKRKPIGAPLGDVIEFILSGIESEWGDPIEYLRFEEGEFIGDTLNIYNVFDEVELYIENQSLSEDIVDSIKQKYWCSKYIYNFSDQDRWFYRWKDFTNYVKHKNRYLFYRLEYDSNGNDFEKYSEEKILYKILNLIEYFVKELNLIKFISIGTKYYRARINHKGKTYSSAKELGPPPIDKAIFSNRMSPAGISMFYGAYDKETAIAEVCNDIEDGLYVTVAEFLTLKDLKVLDLTEIPNAPSIFDENERYLRSAIIFLKSFRNDLTKRIEKDGMEHIEYVPTQIVTEYFRYVFKDEFGERIKGIIYPSSQDEDGISCVLFFESNDCTQDNKEEKKENKWLEMKVDSIEKIRID